MRLYGVVGWKNAGKTGLMERLVTEITGRGLAIADHEGHDDFPPFRVGLADDRDLLDSGMLQQGLFDLAGIDVGPAGDHQVFGAVMQGEIAVVIQGINNRYCNPFIGFANRRQV